MNNITNYIIKKQTLTNLYKTDLNLILKLAFRFLPSIIKYNVTSWLNMIAEF